MGREHIQRRVKTARTLEDLARGTPRDSVPRKPETNGSAFEGHKHVRLHLRGSVVVSVSVTVDERVAGILVARMIASGMTIAVTYPERCGAVRVATDLLHAAALDEWTEELTSRLAGIEV